MFLVFDIKVEYTWIYVVLWLRWWRFISNCFIIFLFQLVKRVYKGIPLQLRGQAWALLLDLEKVKQDNPGKYEVGSQTFGFEQLLDVIVKQISVVQKMKQQARNFSTEIKQIDLDVNRTFRNHIMFMDRFGVKWVLHLYFSFL